MSKTKVEISRCNRVGAPCFVRPSKRPKTCKLKACNPSSTLGHSQQSVATTQLMLPADVEPLDSQIAGHTFEHGKTIGMLKQKDEFVLKPIANSMGGERELRFYEELQRTNDPALVQLRQFVPSYHGTRTITVNNQEVTCLVLENVTKGFKEPCIIDIKIGRRTWDPLATKEKIDNEQKKYVDCKRDLGFCIPGFQVRKITDGKIYKFNKDYGKQLNKETVEDALKIFLNIESGLCRPLLVQLLGLLWKILHWCRTQRKIRLYSSSLLLVYDARMLRHFLQNTTKYKSPTNNRFNQMKLDRPLSLALSNDQDKEQKINPGFSGQFTSDGPKFERSLSTNSPDITPVSSVNNNCPWKKSLKKLQRTHSFTNNYDKDLQNLKENYTYILDDLVCDSSSLWANAKMIDFAHVFPSEGNSLDKNYLEGIENLVRILERFLQILD